MLHSSYLGPVDVKHWIRRSTLVDQESRQAALVYDLGHKRCITLNGREHRQYDGIGIGLRFAPCNGRLAYSARRGRRWFWVWGREESPLHDGIGSPPVFSPDGRRMAIVARRGSKWLVVVDGRPGREYDRIVKHTLTFSPDGRRIAYGAVSGAHWFLVQEGREGKRYDGVGTGTVRFSPDGKHMSYLARRSDQWIVVHDDQELMSGSGAVSELVTSPDGKHTAYAIKEEGKQRVVLDGRKLAAHDAVWRGWITFSPDGRRIAYVAQDGKKWRVVTKDGKGPAFDELGDAPAFCQDSRSLSYLGIRGDRWVVVLNHKETGTFDSIRQHTPVFSPDCRHLAFVAKQGEASNLIVDGGRLSKGKVLSAPSYSPDGKRMAWVEEADGLQRVMVNGRPFPPVYHVLLPPEDKPFFDSRNNLRYMSVAEGPDGAPSLFRFEERTSKENMTHEQARPASATAFGPDMTMSGLPDGVEAMKRLGRGHILRLVHSSKGKTLGVMTTTGIALYDGETLAFKRFIPLGHEHESNVTEKKPTAIAISSSGKQVALGLSDGSVRLIDAGTGNIVMFLRHKGEAITHLTFSRNGRRVAALTNDGWMVWQMPHGRLVREETASYPSAIVFSPGGRSVAVGTIQSDVRVYSTRSGVEILALKLHDIPSALGFSSSGGLLTVATKYGSITTYRAWDGARMREHPRTNVDLETAVLSADQRWWARVPEGQSLQVGPLEGDAKPKRLKICKRGAVSPLPALSPGGRFLAVACRDGALRLYRTADNGLVAADWQHPADIVYLSFNEDGRRMLTGTSTGPKMLWRTKGNQKPSLHHDPKSEFQALKAKMATRAGILVEADMTGRVLVRRVSDLKTLGSFKPLTASPRLLAISPDGQLVATVPDRSSALQIWRTNDGHRMCQLDDGTAYDVVVFSADGRLLAAGAWDLRVWSVGQCKLVKRFKQQQSKVVGLAFSPDSRSLSVGHDQGSLRFIDLETGQARNVHETAGGSLLLFSPAGKLFLSVNGRRLTLWRTSDTTLLSDWHWHQGKITSAAFLSDKGPLATASEKDGTVQLWRIQRLDLR